MATAPDLYALAGLPGESLRDEAASRMREHFERSVEPLRKADAWWERLGNQTGLPTYHDVFAGTDQFEEWVREHDPDAVPDDGDSENDDDDDDGIDWQKWLLRLGMVAGVVYYIYDKLDHDVVVTEDVAEDIPGFEIDGYPWTVEKMRTPGPPMAARVGDPMLHGGTAVPGPGSGNVKIGGRCALTVDHGVGACPMPHVSTLPHIPMQGRGAWRTTNGSVYVNGAPLLRAGDWVIEHLGGNNPIVAGAPTVIAGPPGRPCLVQEIEYRGLPGGIERMGSLGGKYTFKASVSWNMQDMAGGMLAAGLVALGDAFPLLAPVTFPLSRLMLAVIDGPTLEMEVSVEKTFFMETRHERDWNDDGVVDYVRLTRTTTTVTGSRSDSVVLSPRKPGRAKDSKEGGWEWDTDVDVDVQFLDPDEAREPWEDR